MTLRATEDGTVRDDLPAADDFGLVVRVVSTVVPTPGTAGTLSNGTRTAVGAAAVSILAANPNRVTAIIQDVGVGAIIIGVAGLTADTGILLLPNATMTFSREDGATQEIFAISDTVDSIAFAAEVV